MKTKKLKILTLTLLMTLIYIQYLPVSSGYVEPITDDWIITGTEYLDDTTLVMEADIIVRDDGELIVTDSSIRFKCNVPGEYGIYIEGVLITERTTISSDSENYIFRSYSAGEVRMSNTTVKNAGIELDEENLWKYGLHLSGENDRIVDCEISEGYGGLMIEGKAVLKDTRVIDNLYNGILLHGGELDGKGLLIEGNGARGVTAVYNANLNLSDTEISANSGGILIGENSFGRLKNVTITKTSWSALSIGYIGSSGDGGEVVIDGLTISDSKEFGMLVRKSKVNIDTAEIKECQYNGIRLENSHANFTKMMIERTGLSPGFGAVKTIGSEFTLAHSNIYSYHGSGSNFGSSSVNVTNTHIQGNIDAHDRSNVYFVDSTLNNDEISISGKSRVYLVNSTDFTHRITDGELYIGWKCSVHVADRAGDPIPGVTIYIKGNENSTQEQTRLTDENGTVRWAYLFSSVFSSGVDEMWLNPYNITADLGGFYKNSTTVDITDNTEIHIELEGRGPLITHEPLGSIESSRKSSVDCIIMSKIELIEHYIEYRIEDEPVRIIDMDRDNNTFSAEIPPTHVIGNLYYRILAKDSNNVTSKKPYIGFYTVSIVDTIVPDVISFAPSGNNVPRDSEIRIQFNKRLDRTMVEDNIRIHPEIGGEFRWENDTVVVFVPEEKLQNGQEYTVEISDIADIGGNIMEPREFVFTTDNEFTHLMLWGVTIALVALAVVYYRKYHSR